MSDTIAEGIAKRGINRVENGEIFVVSDDIAVESAHAIYIQHRDNHILFSNTLCTPSDLADLCRGMLWSENVLPDYDSQAYADLKINCDSISSTAIISSEINIDIANTNRLQSATPSCGWCGRETVAEVIALLNGRESNTTISISVEEIVATSKKVHREQPMFALTGGVHAAALVEKGGNVSFLREDVGRHNAVDKVLGACIANSCQPSDFGILFLSGRAGLELMHKAAISGIEIVISIGAPTSMAVDVARATNITLVGFVKENSLNIYTNPHRIVDNH